MRSPPLLSYNNCSWAVDLTKFTLRGSPVCGAEKLQCIHIDYCTCVHMLWCTNFNIILLFFFGITGDFNHGQNDSYHFVTLWMWTWPRSCLLYHLFVYIASRVTSQSFRNAHWIKYLASVNIIHQCHPSFTWLLMLVLFLLNMVLVLPYGQCPSDTQLAIMNCKLQGLHPQTESV